MNLSFFTVARFIHGRFLAYLGFGIVVFLGVFGASQPVNAGTITVTSNVDTNARDTVLSFREALMLSNGTLVVGTLDATEQTFVSGGVGAGTADTINFAIATVSKVITITASTPLPAITDGSTIIDGYTQASTSVNTNATGALNMTLLVELNGQNASTGSLITFSSSNNLVRGLVVRLARITGITSTAGANNNVVQGNIIGLTVNDSGASANVSGGIVVVGGTGWIIGTNGDGVNDAAERNVISGNTQSGISLTSNSDSNVIAGNIIGLRRNGTTDQGNSLRGIRIDTGSDSNRIGTNGDNVSDDVERNVISGNSAVGIYINASDSNVIAGNFIGPNVNGNSISGITSTGSGIRMETGADNNIIGTNGSNDAFNVNERNILSGNSEHGVAIDVSAPTGNIIAGNYIGVDVGGTIDLGNTVSGIATSGGSINTRIGTDGNGIADADEGNVISGNNQQGIGMGGASNNAIIAGNKIGTNAAGTGAIANSINGIAMNGSTGMRVGTNGDGTSDTLERNIISGNTGVGVVFESSANNGVVAGNYIGVDVTGTVDLGNNAQGVFFSASSGGRVGTNSDGVADTDERNIISGNGNHGVDIFNNSDNVVVAGNYIGVNAAGTAVIGNTLNGVTINTNADGNTIGTNGNGTGDASEGNIISGNERGVYILSNSSTNTVAGNYIGVDVTGTLDFGNSLSGVSIENAHSNQIGTDGDGVSDVLERNVISGNNGGGGSLGHPGVYIITSANNNHVAGNYIGTNAAGTSAIGNAYDGILLDAAGTNVIGVNGDGSAGESAEGNLISGNLRNGILIYQTSNTVVAGNIIGLNATGAGAIANTQHGIELSANTSVFSNTRIGTNANGVSDTLERNIISGNTGAGVQIEDSNITGISTGVVIAGNYIGSDITGLLPIGNGNGSDDGINLYQFVQGTIIGFDGTGTASVERNVIVANGWAGIYMWNGADFSSQTVISSNYVGVGSDGTTAMGNYVGIFVDNYVNDIIIGGDTLAEGNIIAHSTGDAGIEVMNDPATPDSDGNRFSRNSIFGNFDMAIDITADTGTYEADGVTPNDVGDVDTGANEGMNFPVLTGVTADGVNITINGTLDTPNASTASIEVYLTNGSVHATGHGDLLTFLGTATPVNNSPGSWSLVVANSELNPRLSAIAIDAVGNTSEPSCTWPPSVPDAITGLTATGLDTHVTLDWTEPYDGCSPITDYTIEYGLTAGFPGNATVFVDGISGVTSADVTGLTNNVSYSFRIYAVNMIGTSAVSNTAVATPTGIPDPIDDLSATSSDTQLVLTWTTPPGSINDYVVQCGATAGLPGSYATFDEGTSIITTAIVTGLTNETSYSCRVFAVNGIGSSPTSNVVVETPNTATWVLNTTDTLLAGQDDIAITNVSGHIEVYGVTTGAGNSNQRGVYDSLATAGTRWTTTTVFPNRFGSGKAFFSGGLNYVFGQNNTTFTSAQVYSIVPEGGAVTPLTAFSVVPYQAEKRYAMVGGYVYALGGTEYTVQNFSDVFRYEIATNTWVTTGFAPNPGPARRQATAEAMDGLIYYAGGDPTAGTGGGGTSGSGTTRLDVYNPVTDTWDITKAPMPVARAESCSTVYDGFMYIISGRGATSVRQEVLRYDPTFDEWSKASSLTKQRKYCSATVSNNLLHTFFGQVQGVNVQHNDFETMSVANSAPTTPTNLFVDETDAQTGGNNPTALASSTPVFSAICNDPNWSDRLDQYRIQVDNNNDFSSVVWDSGAQAMTDCRQGDRSEDLLFGGTPLVQDGSTYYWRIKFWDDAGLEGAFSETTATSFFTLFNINDAPSAPTALFVNNSNAQLGSTNPTDISSTAPVFTAICNDADTGDILNQYRIQVDNNNDFSSVIWDSGAVGMSNCVAGARSSNITFGGAPLPADGTLYYWRIKFWDDEAPSGTEGAFSESPLSTNTFTYSVTGGGSSAQRIQQIQQDNNQQIEEEKEEVPGELDIEVPQISVVNVIDHQRVRFEWTYSDTQAVLGFRLLNNQLQSLAQVSNPTAIAITETGLAHNTLVSGRRVVGYNEDGQSAPSAVYPDVYTWMIPTTPRLISRAGRQITVGINETLNNIGLELSGVQYELIPLSQTTGAAVLQSPWVKEATYRFDSAIAESAYLLRSRARNVIGVVTEWSSTINVDAGEVLEAKPNLRVGLQMTSHDGLSLSAPLNPNSVLSTELTINNDGEARANTVVLTLPLPRYIVYVPGTLSVDGRKQTDGADGDFGQSGNQHISAVWDRLDFGFGHSVRFQLGFDTQQLAKDLIEPTPTVLAQALAAVNPTITLQAQANSAEFPEPILSNALQITADTSVLLPPVAEPMPEPVPTPAPTPEQVQIIQQILQQQFPNPDVQTNQPTIPQGETVSSFDGGSFSLSTVVGDTTLTLNGHALAKLDLIQFSGTTSIPFAVITLIINNSMTVIATADSNGNWQTFVSAEQLGLQAGEQRSVTVEAIAASGAIQSERVQIGEIVVGRSASGDIVADFQTQVSEQGFVGDLQRAAQSAVENLQENEQEIQTTLAVSAPVVILSSAPLWGYLPYAPTLIYHFISWMLGFVGRKRKDSDVATYGVVYDAITKLPLALAIVRIYNQADNKLANTIVTDKLGRYDALLAPGQYRLEVSKPQYQYPSGIVTSTSDGTFDRVYNKQSGFTVTEQGIVLPHVPVDPINSQRQWQLSFGLKKLWLAFQRAGNVLATPIILVGLFMSLALLYAVPSKPSNWIIAGLYALTLAIQFKLKPKLIKAWGVVYDVASNAILPLVTIQLIEPATSKVVTSRLSDYEGRFTFLPEPGTYVVKASKPGFSQVTEVVQSPYGDRQPLPQTIDIKKPSERVSGDVPMKQGT